MSRTDERMLQALSRALRFEDDGVAYYGRAMKLTSNKLTLDVLGTLRDQEVRHKEAILAIYERVEAGGSWTGGDVPGAPMPDFVSVFRRMGGEPPMSATQGEPEALRHALDVEAEGMQGMYGELAGQAPTDQERRFYELLGDEELTHAGLIEDSIEYFTDPDAWFVKHEHSVLDGA